jgi:hypothetical protein
MSMIEVAKTQLTPEDHVVKSYRAIHDRKEGLLVFSNHKLMFIAEEGLFRKKYQVFLEVDYDVVESVSIQASHRLEVTDKNGLIHAFTSFGIVTAILIKNDTQKLIAREK